MWLEECADAGVPPFINMVGIVLAGGALLLHGTEEQREQFLRPTATGEIVWCQLFSEPGAGSDLASLTTRARRDGSTYVVDGQKTWCSGGRCADWGILLARMDDAAPKHRGLSFFVVPMSSPGIEVRPVRQMTGESHFDEVFFTDLRLPASALLGAEHEGWAVAMSVLSNERGHVGASARATLRAVDELARIADHHGVSPQVRVQLMRLVVTARTYSWLAGRATSNPLLGSLMKLGVTELMFEIAMLRGTMLGIGALADAEVSGSMLAAPGGRIAGGSSEIQRNIVAERLLGLPRDPAPR